MTIPGEIADAIVSALESPAAQAELIAAITAGEVPLQSTLDALIDGVKVGGVLGIVVNAMKGSIKTELAAVFAQYPPATIAAYLTKLAQEEAKALGG